MSAKGRLPILDSSVSPLLPYYGAVANGNDVSGNEKGFDDDFSKLNIGNSEMKTGRQRKKLAARGRGGEFMTKENKKKVYFCCIASEIDLDILHDRMPCDNFGLESNSLSEVLHLHSPFGIEISSESKPFDIDDKDLSSSCPRASSLDAVSSSENNSPRVHVRSSSISIVHNSDEYLKYSALISKSSCREVFVFGFGAVVFWGFNRKEAARILACIRSFTRDHILSEKEFMATEDDVAFVVSESEQEISIANDVISLPASITSRERLSLSFAIAQSTVLALFEARIEKTVTEHKYIPETLASSGKIKLSTKQLGTMIGEIFVIQHSVNLNTEILDTPDMFWREDESTQVYKLAKTYFEIDSRASVLNTRLNMLKDLLRVLQQQHESAHSVKLEWIVIWLIVVSVGVELCTMVVQLVSRH